MNFDEKEMDLILRAIKFSADKHRHQRRKGEEALPYVNHPIDVAESLWSVGGVRDVKIIAAAILHDTIEDTEATADEIEQLFGPEVLALVKEVSDDKSLPKAQRKQLQIEHAAHKSAAAKQIKLADKMSNVRDITSTPPSDWSLERKSEYLDWADKIVAGLRGANRKLEDAYDEAVRKARLRLEEEKSKQSAIV